MHKTWTDSGIQKSFWWNKMQQCFSRKRDTVQWGVRVYLSGAYFTAEIVTSFTSLKAVFLSFSIQIEEHCFAATLHLIFLLSAPLLSSPYKKLDPPSLRDMVLILFDLCEHSMGFFHSSSWLTQTHLESRYCHSTVLSQRKKKLCLLVQQGSKLGLWCGPLSSSWGLLTLSGSPVTKGKSTTAF